MICRVISRKRGLPNVKVDHELFGLGAASVGTVLLGGLPCGHGIANSLHLLHSSAATRVWSIILGICVFSISEISIFRALLAKIPKAVLSCIVIDTLIPVLTFESKHSTRWMATGELFQFITTMFFCFLYGMEGGLCVGICLSIIQFMSSAAEHGVAELGRLPNQSEYRDVDNHPDALVSSRILIARLRDNLSYINWYPVEDELDTMINQQHKMTEGEHLIGLVINLVHCATIDSTAAFGLLDFCTKYAKQGIAVRFSEVEREVENGLTKVGVMKIHDLGIAFKFHEDDHSAIRDIAANHVAVHDTGSVLLSDVPSPAEGHGH